MIKDCGLLYPPTPIAKALNICAFHNAHRHTTAQCRDLKNQVEDLVRNQYLNEFIEGSHPVVDLQCGLKENTKTLDGSDQ